MMHIQGVVLVGDFGGDQPVPLVDAMNARTDPAIERKASEWKTRCKGKSTKTSGSVLPLSNALIGWQSFWLVNLPVLPHHIVRLALDNLVQSITILVLQVLVLLVVNYKNFAVDEVAVNEVDIVERHAELVDGVQSSTQLFFQLIPTVLTVRHGEQLLPSHIGQDKCRFAIHRGRAEEHGNDGSLQRFELLVSAYLVGEFVFPVILALLHND